MIQRIESEIKIAGINFFIISTAFVIALLVISAIAGDLLDFYPISFEVIFPFFIVVVVGEWGKTRADSNFDIIAAQTKSLFQWVLIRFISVFGMGSIFAILCMLGTSILRYEYPIWELLFIYFPPAFFLSSVCVLIGLNCLHEHVATLACGIGWLTVLLIRSLLQIPGVEYIYLFIRYAGDINHIWLWNKGIITVAGLLLWLAIYCKCKSSSH